MHIQLLLKNSRFQANVPFMEKPSEWFLSAKCVKKTCGRGTF